MLSPIGHAQPCAANGWKAQLPQFRAYLSLHVAELCLVAGDGGTALGWAALGPVSSRCVYAGVGEVSVYVDPSHQRRGIGRALLRRCELEAARAGFARFELMATLPGLRLYAQCGYIAGDPTQHPLGGGIAITFVPMTKRRSIASEE